MVIDDIKKRIETFTKLADYQYMCNLSEQPIIVKQAFDTRRINQETQLNPRRGAQYYQRSEPFLRQEMTKKVNTFNKIKTAVDDIKSQYIGSTEWLDSNCRVLSEAVNRTLRVEQRDMDYSDTQLDYLTELLYLRYRLGMDEINSSNTHELKMKILAKDEKLTNSLYKNSNYVSAPIQQSGVDQFFGKLLDGVKASVDNKDVERSLTLTVRDKINDIKKES
jgi:hypothetical protein